MITKSSNNMQYVFLQCTHIIKELFTLMYEMKVSDNIV